MQLKAAHHVDLTVIPYLQSWTIKENIIINQSFINYSPVVHTTHKKSTLLQFGLLIINLHHLLHNLPVPVFR